MAKREIFHGDLGAVETLNIIILMSSAGTVPETVEIVLEITEIELETAETESEAAETVPEAADIVPKFSVVATAAKLVVIVIAYVV